MCKELVEGDYRDAERIKQKNAEIRDAWSRLLDILHKRQQFLSSINDLTRLLRDIDALSSEFHVIEVIFGRIIYIMNVIDCLIFSFFLLFVDYRSIKVFTWWNIAIFV